MINRRLSEMAAFGFMDLRGDESRFKANSGLETDIPMSGSDECNKLDDDGIDCTNTAPQSQERVRALKVENFGLVFMAMGAAYGLSVAVFLAEIAWFHKDTILKDKRAKRKRQKR